MPVIEKGIPIPLDTRLSWTPWFDALNVGDQLYIEPDKAERAKVAARAWSKRRARTILIRADHSKGMGGCRIARIT